MSTSKICIECNKRNSMPAHDYCRGCWLYMLKPADKEFYLKSLAIEAEKENADLRADITHLKMLIQLGGERENKLKVQLEQLFEIMSGWEKLARERGARWVKLEEAIPEIHSALELKIKMEELEKTVGGELLDEDEYYALKCCAKKAEARLEDLIQKLKRKAEEVLNVDSSEYQRHRVLAFTRFIKDELENGGSEMICPACNVPMKKGIVYKIPTGGLESKHSDKIFHDHIKAHFEKEHPDWKVNCTICDTPYDEIVNSGGESPEKVGVADNEKDDEELPQGEPKPECPHCKTVHEKEHHWLLEGVGPIKPSKSEVEK